MSKKKEIDTNTSIFENKNNDNVNIPKQLIGLLVFTIIFIGLIPYLLIKNGRMDILEGYIPNIDMIATVVGFQREPFINFKSYFKYLYNPDSITLYGYFSQLFINYFALLGLTFLISYYTYAYKSIVKGWSRAITMLPITYLLPNNIIAFYMSKLNNYFERYSNITNKYIQDIIIYGVGLLGILFFIFTEKILIQILGNKIAWVLSNYFKLT